jgi:hypothetical protein
VGYASKIAGTLTLAGMIAAAAPASAAVETFASFTQLGQGSSIRWAKTTSGGTLFTTSTPGGTTAGKTKVNFNYLTSSLGNLGPLAADFTMTLKAENGNPAFSGGGFLIQSGLTGSFSFIYTGSGFTIGDTTYTTGTNLLSGTIGQASIAGAAGSSSGGVSASTDGGSAITYTSDVLAFRDGSNFDFALTLTQIASVLNRPAANQSLRNFTAAATGSFSSDPAPQVIALPVPETATWGLMLVGFGAIGGALRSRRSNRELASL